MQCINKENDSVFDENDVEFLEQFCKQISVSVGNALAYKCDTTNDGEIIRKPYVSKHTN